ncbi:DFP2-like protein, partial [Euroglyphus maynei]
MLKFFILSTAVVLCGASYGGGGGGGYGGYGSIEAAIYSNHKVDVIPVPSKKGYGAPTYIDVPGGALPVYINFQSQSSPVYVKQQHYGMSGSYQKSYSYDEPHKLVHEVTKPIVQEVREVIKPYRKVVQTIKPVHEEVLTLVHKGTGYGDGGYGGSGGGGGGGGYGGG